MSVLIAKKRVPLQESTRRNANFIDVEVRYFLGEDKDYPQLGLHSPFWPRERGYYLRIIPVKAEPFVANGRHYSGETSVEQFSFEEGILKVNRRSAKASADAVRRAEHFVDPLLEVFCLDRGYQLVQPFHGVRFERERGVR